MMTESLQEKLRTLAGVRFHRVGKVYHFDYSAFPTLVSGDYVIVETTRGRQMGQIVSFIQEEPDGRDYRPILRPATPRDLVLKQHWEALQPEALDVCLRKARDLGGFEEAKFIAAQYNYDGTMLTFLYTCDEKVRINTNRLLSELGQAYPDSAVEIRQIGPRDVAKLLGGFGACGETRCCSTFLTDFSPISIKMAKAQGISLNPTEITGMCGRLRCCLVYEYEQYVEARRHLPKLNKRIGTPHGEGKVIDVLPLQDAVLVLVEDTRYLVLRDDLAPLEELAALQKKAKEPCSKHENGDCDCGAQGEKTAQAPEASQDAAETEVEDED